MIKTIIVVFLLISILFTGKIITETNHNNQNTADTKTGLFAPGIISSENNEHSSLIFTKNGSRVFWAVSSISIPGKQDIYYSDNKNNKWTAPKTIPSTISEYCGSPALSSDGKYLYYLQKDSKSDKKPIQPQIMWKIKITDNMLSNTIRISGLIKPRTNRFTMTFCFAGNGNLYYDQGGPLTANKWEFKIYKRVKENGVYKEPVLITDGINKGGFNWTPWVSPDEKTLIFASTRKSNGDLYICYKRSEKSWSNPVLLSAEINSTHPERFPSLSHDGKFIFFARARVGHYRVSDYYRVNSRLINNLKNH